MRVFRLRRRQHLEVPSFPRAPENIRIVLADGTQIPRDALFDGYDSDGMARWYIVGVLPADLASVEIGVLPARTSIGFRVAEANS